MTRPTSSSPAPLRLHWLPGRFAIARLKPDQPIPLWAIRESPLFSITRTTDELSIVALDEAVPPKVQAERDFVALRVVGTLDFSEVGILASLTGALADAGISVVAISTYDTDYLLVRAKDQHQAEAALHSVAGFESA